MKSMHWKVWQNARIVRECVKCQRKKRVQEAGWQSLRFLAKQLEAIIHSE